MKLESLHVGMKVRHPHYGLGTVRTISATTAEIEFSDEKRSVAPEPAGLEPAEPRAALTGLEVPLKELVQQTVQEAVDQLGIEAPGVSAPRLANRWHRGKLVLHPADPTLQTKEVPLETFFHKIVGMRNQLRVLEQKINAHEGLSDADKVDIQQYITRCYGSMTTFNILFKEKSDQV